MSETRKEQPEDPDRESVLAFSEQHIRLLYRQKRTERWFKVITAIMLSIVAVATAWSGYQAARWDGFQFTEYAQASALRVLSTRDSTMAGQVRLYDITAVNNWINAYTQGNTTLATLYEKRFRPEFKPTFEAWLALDPFNNPNAPPGPLFMPQYKLSLEEQANQLDAQAEKPSIRARQPKSKVMPMCLTPFSWLRSCFSLLSQSALHGMPSERWSWRLPWECSFWHLPPVHISDHVRQSSRSAIGADFSAVACANF